MESWSAERLFRSAYSKADHELGKVESDVKKPAMMGEPRPHEDFKLAPMKLRFKYFEPLQFSPFPLMGIVVESKKKIVERSVGERENSSEPATSDPAQIS